MATRIRDTILDGNMGEGWTDEYVAAVALAGHIEAAYRREFGNDADIDVRVVRNASGAEPALFVESDEGDDDMRLRAEFARTGVVEAFMSNPPAELVA